jgi:asparagine synthase (glutamine-hydrolysing)
MKDLLGDVLSPDALKSRGLFDPAAVQSLRDLNQSRKIDVSYPIFSMACIEMWCRLFLDGEAPALDEARAAPLAVSA